MEKNSEYIQDENGIDALSGSESTIDINTDDNVAGTNRLNQNLDEDDLVEKLNGELQEQKDKFLRLLAEFKNYKDRTDREKAEIYQTAGKKIIISLLDVLDDMDRAEDQLNKEKSEKELSGVLLVFSKLRNILKTSGLKAMESLHTEFDVEKQEAIGEMPAQSPEYKGKVVVEVARGYCLNDKIIRFAKVIVGK